MKSAKLRSAINYNTIARYSLEKTDLVGDIMLISNKSDEKIS